MQKYSSERAMSKETVTVLGIEDSQNYEQTIADMVKAGNIISGTVDEIVQMMLPGDHTYIGAWIVVDGPFVAKSSGKEPAWRKYVYVTPSWEERVFDDIGKLYDFIAHTTFRKHRFTRQINHTFALADVSTFDAERWVQRHGTE